MRRLDRYVLAEVLGPLGLGLLVYTFILLVQRFFSLAEMIIRRGVPASTVGKLLVYSLPNIVVLTLPMALLLGVLLGIGRLASDSELVALRSTGVSIFRLLRPIVLLALVLTGLNFMLMMYALPHGNSEYSKLFLEILTRTAGQQFEPRNFYSEFQGKTLWVYEVDSDGGWKGVFLADAVPSERSSVVVADEGRLEVDEDGERVYLRLRNAVEHAYEFAHPDRYETRLYPTLRLLVRDRFSSGEVSKMQQRKSMRSMFYSEYERLARDPRADPATRNLARVEMQKRFAIPAACLALGILAVPLGFTNRRGGKSSGFALSIGIFALYYLLITQGEESARVGKLSPVLAMWMPNLLLGAVGAMLLVQRNRDLPLIPRRLRRWRGWRRGAELLRGWSGAERRRIAETSGSRPAGSGAPARGVGRPALRAHILLRLPRLRLRFPNRIDRYVLARFGAMLALVLASGVTLSMIADFTENVDDILRNQPGAPVLVRYYKYQVLQFAYEVAPIAALVTTLVTFGLLARSNEVIATRALGISLYRLGVPALAGAALLGLVCAFLQAQVLPASNQKVAEAKDRIKGRASRVIRSPDKQWLFGQGRFMYNFLDYDARGKRLQRLQVFEFDERNRLVARLLADEARHDEAGWTFSSGWSRTFDGNRTLGYLPFVRPVLADLPEEPEYFAGQEPRPQQMTYGQLREHVKTLRDAGQRRPELEVALLNKISFPLGSVVMAMVALPFGFRLERRGALYGLGVAIVLGMVFMAVYALFKTLGEAGAFPAAVAVWSPSVLFALLSAYLFLGVRS
jgi:LPS export ABC transporter permease LptF/LPS export ABC transporter permease LptG